MIILSILVFLVIFSVLVLVHEWGHFYAARKSGVRVEEFALGMGKKLWSTTKDGVEYSLNAIPFGGYVRMLGEDGESPDPASFSQAALWKRMIITLAGVFMNFVLTIVVLTLLFTIGTNPFILTEKEYNAAIDSGVIITETQEDGSVLVTDIQKIKLPFPQSLEFAVTETGRISAAIFEKITHLPIEIYEKKGIPDDISGPLGIAEATHKLLPQGIMALLKLTALLSLSLAIMNLLPIPALDGGRFLFQIIEAITFRKPPAQWENAIHVGGFLFLMILMVVITWNDVLRIFFAL